MEPTPAKPWYKKLRYTIPLGAVAFVTVASAMGGGEVPAPAIETNPVPVVEALITQPEAAPTTSTTNKSEVKIEAAAEVQTKPAPAPTPKPQAQSCHPSYSGCLNPNASDYDCAGGSGNGPYYTGPVRVLGADVFDLDRDNDGWACE